MVDWANKNEVFEALYAHGENLKFATAELKADRETVLAAVRQDGSALGYAADELKADREIVLTAVRSAYARRLKFLRGIISIPTWFSFEDFHPIEFASAPLQVDPILNAAAGYHVEREELYLAAYEEVINNRYDKPLLGQALAEADGNIQEATNIYIRMRVAQFSKTDDDVDG